MGTAYIPLCANCQAAGNCSCKGCLLATYCSKACQTKHWQTHKHDCKSPLRHKNWKPQWAKEFRQPSFVHGSKSGPPGNSFGTRKYLWGNMPSIDILQLERNEGTAYDQDINILFAASGDLRNVVKTIACLPGTLSGKVSLVVNDIDFDIVARNVIILMLVLTISDDQQAAETILHFWYSALIRPDDLQNVQSLRSLIEDVCNKIAGRASGSLQAKTFTFGPSSLRVVLEKECWSKLLTFLSVPKELTAKEANQVRAAVTKAPERVDYRHRELILQQPEHRICKERFREEGILLPFSYSRAPFTIPNPTFFMTNNWPMLDNADPLNGYDRAEILTTSAGTATNDLYGKLFVHVRAMLLSFKARLSSFGARFELHNVNATELPAILKTKTFARIESSNICDSYCLGPSQTVCRLAPLLQKPSENRHATLVTLFMNAIIEVGLKNQMKLTKQDFEAVQRSPKIRDILKTDPMVGMFALFSVLPLLKEVDSFFDKYVQKGRFAEWAPTVGMRMKDQHSVVKKWPTRPKLKPDQAGYGDEMAVLLSSDHSFVERYVEWVRTV